MAADAFVLAPALTAPAPDPSYPRETIRPSGWPHPDVPNLSDWLPGDIVLVRREDGLRGWGLETLQRASLNPLCRAAAEWTHAGIYVGNGDIVDATYGTGVVRQSVWNYSQSRAIRLRRVPDPRLHIVARRPEAARLAIKLVGRPYSTRELIASKLLPGTEPDDEALYCSTFVGLCWAPAMRAPLWAAPQHKPLYPAVLAMHAMLDDVPLGWRRL